MRAHQGERELAGEQFVIGKPRPAQTFGEQVVQRGGPVQVLERIGEAGKLVALEPSRILPLVETRQLGQCGVDRLAHLIDAEALGQRIDRLNQRQLVEFGLGHHPIRMGHLQHAVVERGGARHDAPLADREELFEIVSPRVEIGQRQRAGVVVGFDAVWRARAVRRPGPVAVDRHRDGDDRAGLDIA